MTFDELDRERRYELAERAGIIDDSRTKAVADLQRQLAETREVLLDLAQEKGLPEWLSAVVVEREALLSVIKDTQDENDTGHRVCCGVFNDSDEPCKANCEASRLLRLLDPKETQRQVDRAHTWVLRGLGVPGQQRRLHGLGPPPRGNPSGPIAVDAEGFAVDPSTRVRLLAAMEIPAHRFVSRAFAGIVQSGVLDPMGVASEGAKTGEPIKVRVSGAVVLHSDPRPIVSREVAMRFPTADALVGVAQRFAEAELATDVEDDDE